MYRKYLYTLYANINNSLSFHANKVHIGDESPGIWELDRLHAQAWPVLSWIYSTPYVKLIR